MQGEELQAKNKGQDMKKEMTLKEHMEKARAAIDPVKKAAASKENGKLGGRPAKRISTQGNYTAKVLIHAIIKNEYNIFLAKDDEDGKIAVYFNQAPSCGARWDKVHNDFAFKGEENWTKKDLLSAWGKWVKEDDK